MKNKVAKDTSDCDLKNAKVVYIHSIPPYWRDYDREQPTEEGIYVCSRCLALPVTAPKQT